MVLGMRGLLYFILTATLSFSTTAAGSQFARKIAGPFNLADVQSLDRHTNMGPSYLLDLNFTEWFPLEDYSLADTSIQDNILGLTEQNQVYQVVRINGHAVARLLSGKRCIQQIELTEPKGVLLARDCSGNLLAFSNSNWSKTPFRQLGIEQGITTVAGITSITLASYFASLSGSAESASMVAAMGFLSQALAQALIGLIRYGDLNKYPDGFSPIGTSATQLNNLDTRELALLPAEDWSVDCNKLLSRHISKDLLEKH